MNFKRGCYLVITLGCIIFSAPSAFSELAPNSTFDKIESLLGVWQATLPDGNKMDISYKEMNGGAILETYHSQDPMWWNMSSVYHKDNDRILLSHYCSWGNHPRMNSKVGIVDNNNNTIDFKFVDLVENAPDKGHMHHLKITFTDEDHISHQWIWREKGKDTPLTLTLERKP